MNRGCDDNKLDCIGVRLRWSAARNNFATFAARTSSERGLKGCCKAGDGSDRDDGGPCSRPSDASAKGSHDMQSTEIIEMSADFILLDRTLARYGEETKDIRSLIPITIANVLNQRSVSNRKPGPRPWHWRRHLLRKDTETRTPRRLPACATRRRCRSAWSESARCCWNRREVPSRCPFLVVLVFWLALIFASFGLFAPTNSTIIGALIACALSVAGAIFLILELDRPFQGLLQISSAPLTSTLKHLGK
jgi:hypothetical protein